MDDCVEETGAVLRIERDQEDNIVRILDYRTIVRQPGESAEALWVRYFEQSRRISGRISVLRSHDKRVMQLAAANRQAKPAVLVQRGIDCEGKPYVIRTAVDQRGDAGGAQPNDCNGGEDSNGFPPKAIFSRSESRCGEAVEAEDERPRNPGHLFRTVLSPFGRFGGLGKPLESKYVKEAEASTYGHGASGGSDTESGDSRD